MRKISWTISISNVPLPPLSLSCSSSYNFAKFVCKFITEFAKTYKIIGIFKDEYNVKVFLIAKDDYVFKENKYLSKQK